MKANRLRDIALIVAAVSGACSASAATLEYGFSAGAGNTDNVARTPGDGTSETIASLGASIDFDAETSKTKARVKGELEYLDYLDDTYDSDLIGRLDGDARFTLMPGRIFWDIADNFGQAQVDRFTAVTPDNREDINYFATGPEFGFRMGASNYGKLTARYSRADYEISQLDSDRFFAGLTFGHEISDASRVSLNFDGEQLKFDDLVDSDYDRYNAYLRYEVKGARTEINVDAGGTKLEGDQQADGPLLRLEVTRQMSSASRLRLAGGVQTTDGASSFSTRGETIIGLDPTAPATLTSAAFERKYGELHWSYERHRSSVDLNLVYEDDEYEFDPDADSVRNRYELSLGRQFTPVIKGRLFGSYEKSDYQNVAFEDTEQRYGFAIDYRFGRHVGVQLSYAHTSRDATVATAEFDENYGGLYFTYSAN